MVKSLRAWMRGGIEPADLEDKTREMARQEVKAMTSLFDKPFLDYSLQALMSAGKSLKKKKKSVCGGGFLQCS